MSFLLIYDVFFLRAGGDDIRRFGIRQLSIFSRAGISTHAVKMSFLEFKKKNKEILKANWKFPAGSRSLLEMFQKFKTLQLHFHLILIGKLNAIILLLLKNGKYFAAS